MTVGPVTTSRAPKRAARVQSRPVIQRAAAAVSPQARMTPTEHRRRTAFRVSRISEMRRLSPPSRRIVATARATKAETMSEPTSSSGFMN